MRSSHLVSASCLLVLGTLTLGCSDSGRSSATDSPGEGVVAGALADRGEASARLTSLSARFQVQAARRPGVTPAGATPVIRPAVASGFTTDGDHVRPRFGQPSPASARHPRVALPAHAEGTVRLDDEPTGVHAELTLRGATHAAAEAAGGLVLYRGGYRGEVDVVHRPTTEGTEDFLAFEREPAAEVVEYELALGERVAGLRLVADTLELLDATGAPRLRMDPPYIVDAQGQRHAASVTVSGCRVDTDPRAPWGRAVVGAGASTCVVGVAWAGKAVTYPALLDPSWKATGSMSVERSNHVSALLPSGRVLVAGGEGPGLATAEVYDPATATWAVTGALSDKHARTAAVTLASGKVLVAGGFNGVDNTLVAEVFEEATGTWSPTGPMVFGRSGHRLNVLPTGQVLATGGYRYVNKAVSVTMTAELYDPVSNVWDSTGQMSTERADHVSTTLADGKVLVAGGLRSTFAETPLAELYDPAAKTWTKTGPMTTGRGQFAAAVLPSGRLLVMGGISSPSMSTAEVYNPTTGTWFGVAPMSNFRRFPTATRLASGAILVAGGFQSETAETFREQTSAWTPVPSMANGREGHTANLLASGQVLVAGGDSLSGRLASAELYAPDLPAGQACALGGECGSGFCVDGVCCDQACDGACQACTVAGGAQVNGTCVVRAKDSVCRLAAGGCDEAETCDGTSTACPADALKAAGTTCRASLGECDVAETCDGSNEACPTDVTTADGTTCSTGVCAAGVCEGSAGAAGAAGAGGDSGAAGEAGEAGAAGSDAGAAGTAGASGQGGSAGTAGTAGKGGSAGSGLSGSSGQGGTAGSGGTGAVGGSGGAGTGGKAGTGGRAGGSGSGTTAGAAGSTPAEAEGGCDCRVSTSSREPAGGFAFAALAAVAVGRRRRRDSVG